MWQLLSSSVLFCKIIISYGGRLGRGDLRLIVDFSQLKVVLASVLCGHTSPRGFDYSASFPSSGPTMRSKGHSALHSPHNQYLEHKLQFGILASTCCEMQALHGSTNMYILYICCTQCLHVIFSDLYLFAVSNRDTLYPENRQALNLSFPKRSWGGQVCPTQPGRVEGVRGRGAEHYNRQPAVSYNGQQGSLTMGRTYAITPPSSLAVLTGYWVPSEGTTYVVHGYWVFLILLVCTHWVITNGTTNMGIG